MSDTAPLIRHTVAAMVLTWVACLLLALSLMPVRPAVGGLAMPDLVLCLACAWVLRHPQSAPMVLLFALGLAADLLLGRPVGLGALAVVLITEALRQQPSGVPFLLEWLFVTVLIVLASVLQLGLLAITFATRPETISVIVAALVTALCYPLLSLTVTVALRLGRGKPAA